TGPAVDASDRGRVAPGALDRDALTRVPPEAWAPTLEGQLREQIARVLRLPADAVDVDQPLSGLGIDSLMAVELKNRIEADLGVTVPMVTFLEGPSVRDLSEFLVAQLLPRAASILAAGAGAAAGGPWVPAGGLDAQAAGHLLDRLAALSDAQVDTL